MAESVIKFYICLLFFMLILFSCSRYDDVDKYILYTNRINKIIRENKQNTDVAGAAIIKYITENKTSLDTIIKNLNAYTIKQTEVNYNRLMKPVLMLKKLLSKTPAVYPDSVNIEIMNVISENKAVMDEQEKELKKNSRYFLKTAFAPAAATLILIKQLIAEIPLTNFKLSNNQDFMKAAEIMRFDNLVLSAY